MLTSPIPHCIRRLRGSVALPMTSRTRLIITAVFVCHLIFAHSLVTSQLLAPEKSSSVEQPAPHIPDALKDEDVTIRAITQEKEGHIVRLHGQVEIHYGMYILSADEATYHTDTREATADGHVLLIGGAWDEHIRASHVNYNFRGETGHFEHVVATIGIRTQGNRTVQPHPTHFSFAASRSRKPGPSTTLSSTEESPPANSPAPSGSSMPGG